MDCNLYKVSTTKVFVRYKVFVLYLTKTFVIEMLYNLQSILCYMKSSNITTDI